MNDTSFTCYTPTPPMDRTTCTEPQCLYNGAIYIYILVPWSRKSRAIPLLSLWAVRPVQSLSACTRVHFTFFTPPLCAFKPIRPTDYLY